MSATQGGLLGRSTYGCPKYSAERVCSAREDTNPSSSVSPATGWHLPASERSVLAHDTIARRGARYVHYADVHIFIGTPLKEDLLARATFLSCGKGEEGDGGGRAGVTPQCRKINQGTCVRDKLYS